MDLRAILKSGESERVEFKRSFGKDVIISLVAFANTEGGKVVVGVDDTGQSTGLYVGPETEQQYLNEIKVGTYPQVMPHATLHEIDQKSVLVFEINEYPIKPVSFKNRYYKRVKNSNHTLSLDEIVDLQQQSLNVSYDAHPLKENPASLDRSLMIRFMEKATATGRVNLQDDLFTNLIKLRLIQSGSPTLAAMLLFGNHGYAVHAGRFKGAETIIDDLYTKAPLWILMDEVMVFVKKHINLSYHFDGSLQRKERWQYPLEAIRELLLNAVVHRDYRNASDIIIKIFDDRILFTSPGRLFGKLTIEDLRKDDYISSIRNKLLAEALYLSGDIEKYGTGFIRIRQWLKEYPGIQYDILERGDFFMAELFHGDGKDLKTDLTDLKTDLIKDQGLSETQVEIIYAVLENKFITQQQLSERIGITPRNIRNNMDTLKKKGLLERIGPQRGGQWQVILAQTERSRRKL
ncbi:MAG: winged helix-turn-helix transcriptional regulator [Nitrospina sp.]|nr:winged helix-turn-helix transcriptional regulator [Nitrospina sp.]